jgi:hypothetical protein
MALTLYATAAEIKTKIKDVGNQLTDAEIEFYIDEAEDNFIKVDLAVVIDFVLVDALATVPGWLNRLCICKTCVLILVYLYGAKRRVKDVDDIKWFEDCYQKLIDDILAGEVDVGAVAITASRFQWDSREDVKPAFGLDDYGEFKNLEDMQDDRGVDD